MASTRPLNELSVKKSNTLVSAKYSASLLENQVMSLALTRVEENVPGKNAPLTATLYPGELKKLIGDPSHIYRTLKVVSKTMTGHTIFIEDGKGNFKAHAIVTDAEYQNGAFTVRFNENLRDYILGLEKNYTTYELSILTSFKKSSSFRLYEVLKKEIYRSKPSINNGRVDVEYNLSELRFMIGLANSDAPQVKNAMARMGDNVDWDALYNLLDKKDKKYEAWRDLKRYVIEPAQEEMKKQSNVRFTFDTIRRGRSVAKVLFHIYPNDPDADKAEILDKKKDIIEKNAKQSDKEIPHLQKQYQEFFLKYNGHNDLTVDDLDLLVIKACGNTALIEEAIEQADNQNGTIKNYMGWIVRCIERGGYSDSIEVKGKDSVVEVVETPEEEEEIGARVWNKMQTHADFPKFVSFIESKGLTMEVLDVTYTSSEKIDMYVAWKKHKPVKF